MMKGREESAAQRETGVPAGRGLTREECGELEKRAPLISLEYVLKFEEVYASLRRSIYPPRRQKRMVVEAAALIALFAVFVAALLITKDRNNLFLAAVALTLFFAAAVIPFLGMRMDANGIANGHVVHFSLYEGQVVMGSGAGRWKIPLDGTSRLLLFEERLAILYFDTKFMVILPYRCIPEARREEILTTLRAGTRPYE